MNKIFIAVLAVATATIHLSATNLDNIYGKNDLNYNMDRSAIYGNNFGTILDYNPGDPHYIDIQYAESKISQLSSDIELFSEEVNKYENKITADRDNKSEINDLITKIDLLLVELKSTSADLYNTKNTLNDKEMRQKVQISIEENRQQIYDLENKKSQMIRELGSLNNNIEVSGKYITVNNLFIRRNTKEIAYLKSCMEYSNQDSTSIDALVNKSTSFQSEVDEILKVSY